MKFQAVFLAIFLLLTACGIFQPDTLDGTEWELQSLGQDPVLAGTTITAAFEEGQITGRSGCNSYFAPYTAQNGGFELSGPAGATEMACMEPEGVMDQEQGYLKRLQVADKYELNNGQLLLYRGDELVLVFAAQE